MKKLAKLFLFVLVFALMASVLVACGEDKTTPNKPSTPTVTPGNPTEQTGKEEQSEPTKPSTPDTPDKPSEPDEPPHIHAFGEWKVITNPTCTAKGLKKRTCKCGEEETEEIKALGHDIIHHEGKEPTCTEEGYKAYDTCSRCDYTTYEEIEAKGHTEVIDEAVESTCTKTGLTEGKHCSVCKEILVAQEVVSALGHDIIHHDGKEPTCTESGYKEYETCSRCDYTTYEDLPAIGHKYEKTYKYATCVSLGETEYTCSICQNRYKENTALLSCSIDIKQSGSWSFGTQVIAHEYCAGLSISNLCGGIAPYFVSVLVIDIDEKTNLFNQTFKAETDFYFDQFLLFGTEYFENGSIAYFNSSTPAYKNVIYYVMIQDQQDLQSQYSGYMYDVSEQNLEITQSQYAMHHYGEWETTVAPTCTTTGEQQRSCSRCNDMQTETLPANGHSFGEWTTVSAPTCITGGIETRACSVCGTIERRSVDALGHNYGEWKTTKEPTCTETGEKESICSRCNDVQKQTLSALGHSFDDWVVTKEATCQKGSEERACSVCGYVEKKDIPADYTTHIFEGDFCTVCGEHKGTEGLQFELVTNDTVAVTGYTGSSTTVYIPSSYVGATVTSIKAEAFKDNTTITEIVIPDSITSIGSYAFDKCYSLTSVYYTGDIASWCGITFSNEYSNPLYYAHNLYINNEIISGEIVLPNTVTKIPDYTFRNSNITSITISDSVTSIGEDAFSGCSKLTSITIPDSVTSIGDSAFLNCPIETATIPTLAISYIPKSNLKTVVITSGESIGYRAFYNCSRLTNITIPDSVTSIGEEAFEYCSNLTSITISDSVTSIGGYAFRDCDNLTSITIPDSVTSIGSYAFYSCDSLTSIAIPDSVTSIGREAFSRCSSLKSITIPDSITSIGESAFYGCGSLTSITIPDSVTSIGSYAFSYCNSLTSITIPDSVTSIGDRAFEYCSSLTRVYYTGDIASWCGITFSDYDSNPLSYAQNLYFDNELIKDIVIPDTVTGIKAYAFYDWNGTSITIPDSVTSIGESAFHNCSSLTSVTIGDSVTSIRSSAFSDCVKLTSITIPDSVTSIGDYAFSYCSSLTSITFQGTKAQWNAISKGYDWDYYTGNYTVHCTDDI